MKNELRLIGSGVGDRDSGSGFLLRLAGLETLGSVVSQGQDKTFPHCFIKSWSGDCFASVISPPC